MSKAGEEVNRASGICILSNYPLKIHEGKSLPKGKNKTAFLKGRTQNPEPKGNL